MLAVSSECDVASLRFDDKRILTALLVLILGLYLTHDALNILHRQQRRMENNSGEY